MSIDASNPLGTSPPKCKTCGDKDKNQQVAEYKVEYEVNQARDRGIRIETTASGSQIIYVDKIGPGGGGTQVFHLSPSGQLW